MKDVEQHRDNNKLETSYPKKAKPLSQHEKLERDLKKFFLEKLNLDWQAEWSNDLPKKWKHSSDILILPANCFVLEHWTKHNSNEFYSTLAESFRVKRIAQENRVKSDDFRTPNLNLLYGNDPIVTIVNNGVKYSYNITKSMFSWGNITEKLRIASFDCSNETVVDFYAGIGYFTLVYLVHAKAKRVIACEWNPDSVEALKHNLILNDCSDRCEVLLGDNRINCPVNCADRVNLGLLPSSEPSWSTACNALKLESGGYLHIHGNVDVQKSELKTKEKPEWIEWAKYAQEKIKNMLDERCSNVKWNVSIEHIEYVKSYGPRVDHLVLDLCCKPIK